MANKFCYGCNRPTGWKRRFTLWTWLIAIFTHGLWFFAMFLYPQRCKICGMSEVEAGKMREQNPGVSMAYYDYSTHNTLHTTEFGSVDRPTRPNLEAPKIRRQIRGKGLWRTEDFEK